MTEETDESGPTAPPPTPADLAYRALRPRVDAFRLAVSTAEREIRDDLLLRSGAESLKAEQALVELGPFATGRINPDRFAMLLGISEEPLTPESIDVLERADAILAGFAESSRHRLEVPHGGDLRDVVKAGLSQLGQAFGAARAVELARSGTFDGKTHGHLLGPLPFRLWNRIERRMAPPLLVEMRGEDCLPAGLGEFLDGFVTLVLVATGPTTPAPLARLVTPGTLVMQTASVADLARLEGLEHPAVVLLFDEERPEQAHFIHDPDAGDTPWSRLTVSQMPADAPVGRGRRAPVWLEELEHLKVMSRKPTPAEAAGDGVAVPSTEEAPAAAGATTVPPDPADRLASWLLAHTDVTGL